MYYFINSNDPNFDIILSFTVGGSITPRRQSNDLSLTFIKIKEGDIGSNHPELDAYKPKTKDEARVILLSDEWVKD